MTTVCFQCHNIWFPRSHACDQIVSGYACWPEDRPATTCWSLVHLSSMEFTKHCWKAKCSTHLRQLAVGWLYSQVPMCPSNHETNAMHTIINQLHVPTNRNILTKPMPHKKSLAIYHLPDISPLVNCLLHLCVHGCAPAGWPTHFPYFPLQRNSVAEFFQSAVDHQGPQSSQLTLQVIGDGCPCQPVVSLPCPPEHMLGCSLCTVRTAIRSAPRARLHTWVICNPRGVPCIDDLLDRAAPKLWQPLLQVLPPPAPHNSVTRKGDPSWRCP